MGHGKYFTCLDGPTFFFNIWLGHQAKFKICQLKCTKTIVKIPTSMHNTPDESLFIIRVFL